MSDTIAKVLINLSLDRTFDYRIPRELEGRIAPGAKVSVPFGKGDAPRPAYVVSVLPSSNRKELKSILSLCGENPMIPPNLLKLGEWIASYYCCTREQAVRVLLPGAVRNGKIRTRTVPRCYLADSGAAAEYIGKATARTRARAEILKRLFVRGGQSPDALATAAGAGKSAVRALIKLSCIGHYQIGSVHFTADGRSVRLRHRGRQSQAQEPCYIFTYSHIFINLFFHIGYSTGVNATRNPRSMK